MITNRIFKILHFTNFSNQVSDDEGWKNRGSGGKEKQLFDSKIGWIRVKARILKMEGELFGNYFVW